MKPNHIALLKHRRPDTVVMQASTNKDCLSPQAWRYLGLFPLTKTEMRILKDALLEEINTYMGRQFDRLIVQ